MKWPGQEKKRRMREHQEFTDKLIDEGKYDEAMKYAQFTSLLEKGCGSDIGFIFMIIGVSIIAVCLGIKVVNDILSAFGIVWLT